MMTEDSCGRWEICLEEFGRQVTFEGDTLDEARPVAHEQKRQFALVCAVVDPAFEDDVLSDVV